MATNDHKYRDAFFRILMKTGEAIGLARTRVQAGIAQQHFVKKELLESSFTNTPSPAS